MVLPANINGGTPDPFPEGVFLIPLCTTREATEEMIRALDSAFVQTRKLSVIKDFLNALQYINNPQDAMCWSDDPPPDPPVITVETDGDCQRVLIDGVPVIDWICPPDPEQPPPPEPPEPTGRLGFTMCELENMIMGCLDISDAIKMGDDGLIYVRSCDGWVVMEGMIAPVQQTGGTPPSDMSYQEWEARGKPPLPDFPAPAPDQYETPQAKQCAKATAIAQTLKAHLQSLYDALDGVVNQSDDFETLLGVVGVGFAVSAPAAFTIASLIWAARNIALTLMPEIQDNIEDDAMYSSIVCDVTELMNNDTVVGSDDVDWVITNWQNRDTVSETVKQMIYAIPLSAWKAKTGAKVQTTDCDCEKYLPYTPPPAPIGAIDYYDYFGGQVYKSASNMLTWTWQDQVATAIAQEYTSSELVERQIDIVPVQVQRLAVLRAVVTGWTVTGSGGGGNFTISAFVRSVKNPSATAWVDLPEKFTVATHEQVIADDPQVVAADPDPTNPGWLVEKLGIKFSRWTNAGQTMNCGFGAIYIANP